MPGGFWDDLGSVADNVGGWIGDIAGDAVSVADNIAKLQSSLNAVNKPPTGPKPAPYHPAVALAGPPSGGGTNGLLMLALVGVALWIVAKEL